MTSNRTFRFMTGVHNYRIQAASREEALAYAVHALQADENLAKVIESTLYEEGAEKVFAAPAADAPRSEQEQATVYPFRRPAQNNQEANAVL